MPGPQHTEFLVAVHKGFFAKEGLAVTLHSPTAPTDPIKLVASGQDDFGISYPGDIIEAVDKGVPILSIAAIHRRTTYGLMSRPEDKIRSPRDLIGKQIGLNSLPSQRAMFYDFLKRNRIEKDAVHVVTIGFYGAQLLAAKKIDVADDVSWDEPAVYWQITHQWPNNMVFTDYGVPDSYFFVIIATRNKLAEKPDVARGFVKAILEAERWTLTHPLEAQKILLNYAREVTPVFAKHSRMILDKIITDSDTVRHGLGWQSPKVWDRTANWYFDQHLVSRQLPENSLFTNDYLPKPPIKQFKKRLVGE